MQPEVIVGVIVGGGVLAVALVVVAIVTGRGIELELWPPKVKLQNRGSPQDASASDAEDGTRNSGKPAATGGISGVTQKTGNINKSTVTFNVGNREEHGKGPPTDKKDGD